MIQTDLEKSNQSQDKNDEDVPLFAFKKKTKVKKIPKDPSKKPITRKNPIDKPKINKK